MGKIRDLIFRREKEPQFAVADTHTRPLEQRARECGGVLVDAYFQHKDPITGVELSEELIAAIAPFSLQRLSEEIEKQAEIRRDMTPKVNIH